MISDSLTKSFLSPVYISCGISGLIGYPTVRDFSGSNLTLITPFLFFGIVPSIYSFKCLIFSFNYYLVLLYSRTIIAKISKKVMHREIDFFVANNVF